MRFPAFLGMILAAACGKTAPSDIPLAKVDAGSSSRLDGGRESEGADAVDGGADQPTCEFASLLGRRLVRLTFNQIANTMRALLGPGALQGVTLPTPVGDAKRRAFFALQDEGPTIGDQVLSSIVDMAEAATTATIGRADGFAGGTGCPAGDDGCVQSFLARFAERAFRRPVTSDEMASIEQTYAELRAISGMTIEEAGAYAVEAVLIAPQVIYRTELGDSASAPAGQVALTGHELASELSYFLSDAPPDGALLAAAASGSLATRAGLTNEVDRMLSSEETRGNLTGAMVAYYGLGAVDGARKDAVVFPEFSPGIRDAMFSEGATFLSDALWQGPLAKVFTSQRTFVDETLAAFYRAPYPSAGSGFVGIELSERSGVLTLPAWLTSRSHATETSVVARGLYIDGVLLCGEPRPSAPPAIGDREAAQALDETLTERQKAEARAAEQVCASCHASFDPYGLMLEEFDAIGRHRTSYANGTVIETTAPLSDPSGAMTAVDVRELARRAAESGAFFRCLERRVLQYAMAQADGAVSDCALRDLHDRFLATERTFPSLVREVALSRALSIRSAGDP